MGQIKNIKLHIVTDIKCHPVITKKSCFPKSSNPTVSNQMNLRNQSEKPSSIWKSTATSRINFENSTSPAQKNLRSATRNVASSSSYPYPSYEASTRSKFVW